MEQKELTRAEKKALKAKKQRRIQIFRYIKVGAGLSFVLAVVLYLLCALVFFRIGSVVVVPASEDSATASKYYSDEEIINVSGADIGESLVLISKKDVKDAIESLLPYIGNVTVKRSYPSTLKLVVEDHDAFFAVEYNGMYTLLNREFKVLETSENIPTGCAKLEGVEFSEMFIGSDALFEDSSDETRLNNLISECEKAGIENITKYDLTNIANVRIMINYRITFVLGTLTDMEDKLELALRTVDAETGGNPEAHIIIDVTNPDRSYVRDDQAPIEYYSQEETTTQPAEDEIQEEKPAENEVKPEPVG